MLDANWAPLIASRYCFSSGDHAEGPAVPIALGVAVGSLEALEHPDRARLRLAITANATVLDFMESIFNTS